MVRCKFVCESKREARTGEPPVAVFDYTFRPVYSDSVENAAFWKYTPGGQINVAVVLDGTFEVGKPYYVDFNEVTPTTGSQPKSAIANTMEFGEAH